MRRQNLARFLALDWDHQHLHIVAGTAKHGAVRIQKAVALEEGQNPFNSSAAALGALLKERLRAAGIAGAPVLACVGRDRLILKDLRFPAVPPSEEPALVRFQVAKELNDPAEHVVIDYATVPDANTQGERKALALVVKRDVLNTYQELCKVAGLKLQALAPRPFGTLACLTQQVGTTVLTPAPEPPDAAMAVLTVGKPWAEFCVVRGDSLLYSRSLTTGPTLANEVRRNLAVYAGQNPQNGIRAVYVAASGEQAAVRERLQGALDIPVYALDPFAGSDHPEVPADQRGAFSGVVGLLLARSEPGDLPINFIKPKEPRPASDPKRLRVAAAAAVAALILLGAIGFGYAEMAKRDELLGALIQRKQDQEQELARFAEDQARLTSLADWNKKNICWLDELYDMTDRIPDLKSLRVTKLVCNDQPAIRGNKDKYVGHITMEGMTTSNVTPVRNLQNQLELDTKYLRYSHQVDAGRGRGQALPMKFTFKIDLEKLQPDDFTRQIHESSVAPRGPGRFPGAGIGPGSPRRQRQGGGT
jgi:Tfp pilus assembly PilM family ATPase